MRHQQDTANDLGYTDPDDPHHLHRMADDGSPVHEHLPGHSQPDRATMNMDKFLSGKKTGPGAVAHPAQFVVPRPGIVRVGGVGPDAPTAVNDRGGRQSDTPYRADLLPPLATLAVAAVLKPGAEKYGVNNWHKIPVEDHLNHALVHVFAWLSGDRQDGHLEHAACRVLMALELNILNANHCEAA